MPAISLSVDDILRLQADDHAKEKAQLYRLIETLYARCDDALAACQCASEAIEKGNDDPMRFVPVARERLAMALREIELKQPDRARPRHLRNATREPA